MIRFTTMKIKSWKNIKDSIYGKNGTSRRDQLERNFESFKLGVAMTESEFISFVEEGAKCPFISSYSFKKKFNNWRVKN